MCVSVCDIYAMMYSKMQMADILLSGTSIAGTKHQSSTGNPLQCEHRLFSNQPPPPHLNILHQMKRNPLFLVGFI